MKAQAAVKGTMNCVIHQVWLPTQEGQGWPQMPLSSSRYTVHFLLSWCQESIKAQEQAEHGLRTNLDLQLTSGLLLSVAPEFQEARTQFSFPFISLPPCENEEF